MSKVILTEQVRDSFTQEQADQRYLSREGDIANGDITLNIADGRKAFSIANLDTGTYAYLASDSSQAELSLMSLQLTSNSNEASINSSTDININSDSHEVNLNVSSVNVPEPTTNTSAVPKSYVDSNFVSQESGKGLSTNDFTTEEKNKLAGVANNANNYTLPAASSTTLGGVKVGSGLSIDNGVLSAATSSAKIDVVDIGLPTSYASPTITYNFPFPIKACFYMSKESAGPDYASSEIDIPKMLMAGDNADFVIKITSSWGGSDSYAQGYISISDDGLSASVTTPELYRNVTLRVLILG